ncbi:MAG: transketolase [bacterium]|nr:transketolase [bacterium]
MLNNEAKLFSKEIRRSVLLMLHRAKASHVGSNFSEADILSVLYSGVLRVDSQNPAWPERDRFIVSKGHACAAVYVALALKGFFPKDWLNQYYVNDGKLAGHMTHKGVPGVEASTGSLGHGLSIGTGMALAAKRSNVNWRAFVLLSDGELDEGSSWEPMLFAAHHKLDNLIAIVDYNKIQSLTFVKDTLGLEPLADKWRAFGWNVREVDGHDHGALTEILNAVPLELGKPNCIIAHTVKGKGVSFMENNNLWHYRAPNDEELEKALEEIEMIR